MPFGLQPTHLTILLVTGLTCLTPIVIVGGVLYVVAARTDWNKRPSDAPTALDILKMRYAKGEITEEQFNKMKSDVS